MGCSTRLLETIDIALDGGRGNSVDKFQGIEIIRFCKIPAMLDPGRPDA
jgi:hypothetical protein